MARTYRVICAQTEGGVQFLADDDGWKVLEPIRQFTGLDSEDDGSFGDFGRIITVENGFVALCYKEL